MWLKTLGRFTLLHYSHSRAPGIRSPEDGGQLKPCYTASLLMTVVKHNEHRLTLTEALLFLIQHRFLGFSQNYRRQDRWRESQWESGKHIKSVRALRRGCCVLSETSGHFPGAGRQGNMEKLCKSLYFKSTFFSDFCESFLLSFFLNVLAAGWRGQGIVQYWKCVPCKGQTAVMGLCTGTRRPAGWCQRDAAEGHWVLWVCAASVSKLF